MPASAPANSAAAIAFLTLPLPLGRRPTPDPRGRPLGRPVPRFDGGGVVVGVTETNVKMTLIIILLKTNQFIYITAIHPQQSVRQNFVLKDNSIMLTFG